MTCIRSTNQATPNTQETQNAKDSQNFQEIRSPQSALYKNQDQFELTIDLPGADVDTIQVEMKGNRLYVQAPTDQGFQYQRTYRFKSSFSWGEFEAKWESGRLRLTLPILRPLGRKIQIQTA